MFFKRVYGACLLLAGLFLYGCAATQVALEKKDLSVETKMSDSIFLDPVSTNERTIYLQLRNTSDQQQLDLRQSLTQNLSSKGYTLVNNVDQAHFLLQVNLLYAGKSDPAAARDALASGFGGALGGILVGGATGASGRGMASAGLIGAGIEIISGALVKDVTWSLITDLQISVKTEENIEQSEQQSLKQGSSGITKQTSRHKTNRMKYQTRILATANQVNLKFDTALPELKSKLSHAISGLFE